MLALKSTQTHSRWLRRTHDISGVEKHRGHAVTEREQRGEREQAREEKLARRGRQGKAGVGRLAKGEASEEMLAREGWRGKAGRAWEGRRGQAGEGRQVTGKAVAPPIPGGQSPIFLTVSKFAKKYRPK